MLNTQTLALLQVLGPGLQLVGGWCVMLAAVTSHLALVPYRSPLLNLLQVRPGTCQALATRWCWGHLDVHSTSCCAGPHGVCTCPSWRYISLLTAREVLQLASRQHRLLLGHSPSLWPASPC